MYLFEIIGNDTHLGFYIAEDASAARNHAAQDAGYRDEEDMIFQLERPSELWARAIVSVVAIMEIMRAEGIEGIRDWEQGVTTYQYGNHRIVVDWHEVTITEEDDL